jgi:hypothetical protein
MFAIQIITSTIAPQLLVVRVTEFAMHHRRNYFSGPKCMMYGVVQSATLPVAQKVYVLLNGSLTNR